MILINFLKKIIMQEKYNSETYINFLKKKGILIGNGCHIYAPNKTLIDIQNPHMLKIGENVKISEGVKILTHDFSWAVTSNIDGIITGSVGNVEIGNNVFIGMNSIITRNVRIGNNVIIGACSVVTHDLEDNYVYAGVPAKKIMSIYEYHEKRKKAQLDEAINIVKNYYLRYKKVPDKKILREYVFLFEDGNCIEDELEHKILSDSGHFDKCYESLKNNKPQFKDYDEFIKFCEIK